MRRRGEREREEADANEQAEARREALLAELKEREAASRAPEPTTAEPERSEAATDESAEAAESAEAEPETPGAG